MAKSLTFYAIYMPQDAASRDEGAVAVPQGFSLTAFLFHGVWALYYKTWALALACLALFGLTAALEHLHFLSVEAAGMIELGLRLCVGFEAHDWRAASLERRGYRLERIVMARSGDEAMLRFLDIGARTNARHAD